MNHYDTHFSPDRRYRYYWRWTWNPQLPPLMVVGLNPSTADENVRDPTITRCSNYAVRWGYGALWMLNLFAYRATDPREMKAAADPVGPDNGQWLLEFAAEAQHARGGMVLCGWGNHGTHLNRSLEVTRLLEHNARVDLYALRVTKAGQPQHPLYLPGDLKPALFGERCCA